MQQPRSPTPPSEGTKLPGIIDTIGNAFALLNQRPYLIWLPILLDLYLWLGVRLSTRSFTDVIERWLRSAAVTDSATLELIHNQGEHFNLFELLAVATPTLLRAVGRDAVVNVGLQTWITGVPWWLIPLIGLGLAITGVLVGASYLTLIGYLIRGQPVSFQPYLGESGRNSIRMLGLILITILLVVLVALPLLFVGGLMLVLGVNVVPLVAFVLLVGSIWGFFLLFFAKDAIVISNAGPMQAIYLSYNLVRQHFWPALGFISISWLIQRGVPLALNLFTGSPWGVPLALVGNAYIGTGLVAAAMLFYRDRVGTLQPGQQASQPLDQGTS